MPVVINVAQLWKFTSTVASEWGGLAPQPQSKRRSKKIPPAPPLAAAAAAMAAGAARVAFARLTSDPSRSLEAMVRADGNDELASKVATAELTHELVINMLGGEDAVARGVPADKKESVKRILAAKLGVD
jgi:hypothetical protein